MASSWRASGRQEERGQGERPTRAAVAHWSLAGVTSGSTRAEPRRVGFRRKLCIFPARPARTNRRTTEPDGGLALLVVGGKPSNHELPNEALSPGRASRRARPT